jgi:hypothetical protein
MRYEKLVSLAASLLLVVWTLVASQLMTRGSHGATGLLAIRQVSGSDLAGTGDCTNISLRDSVNCPDAYKGAGCTNTKWKCHAATTGQTNDSTCSTGTTDTCQDTGGKCAIGYNEYSSQGGCTQKLVPE